MPVADILVGVLASHIVLTFMDRYSGYNQIFVAKQDPHKTTFRCPRALWIYEWIFMPFGLQYAGATYEIAKNTIFHKRNEKIIEVYINYMVVKSFNLEELDHALQRKWINDLMINLTKYAFGVSTVNFMVSCWSTKGLKWIRIKLGPYWKLRPSTTNKELQSPMGKINFLRRFISNSDAKMKAFSSFLWLKCSEELVWEEAQQRLLIKSRKL